MAPFVATNMGNPHFGHRRRFASFEHAVCYTPCNKAFTFQPKNASTEQGHVPDQKRSFWLFFYVDLQCFDSSTPNSKD